MSEHPSAVERADLDEKYDRMLRLADLFDTAGADLRGRSRLGVEVLADPEVTGSAPLSPSTWSEAETEIRAATTGRHGLLGRSVELDADALVVRATVLTYRWIDELQSAAYETLGSIAGRAIGYLAPEVALGGAIVSAGLIETDALDRDGFATYLGELAENNPELMEHVSSGGGGLLDGLQMRSLLTVGALARDDARLAAAGGLRAVGIDDLGIDVGAAARDIAGGLLDPVDAPASGSTAGSTAGSGPGHVEAAGERAPGSLEELLVTLQHTRSSVEVRAVGGGRFIAYLAGPDTGRPGRLRLVSGDRAAYADVVVRSVEQAVQDTPGARVMLVGGAHGGATAAEVAATVTSEAFVIEQVVTAGAPAAQVPRIPAGTRVLSLEDRYDPVALLGSLINAGADNRLTVVFDGQDPDGQDPDLPTPEGALAAGEPAPRHGRRGEVYVAGGRAADASTHPALVAELARLTALGYLGG
ncbi:hypothetical protein I601_1502 [Nocardioides dokdonensis FR1436]|uniref:Uncharacterized protein n=1 Tax=Nocardioides dokdonensis FR1436 TaxID=1300347 RepID=A0A1A9GI03_9ACTN|nr:hypothetical protein [Nocardioides dokdonensis]ANH37937.1 hypothetical protein I601_1502 [Nocardioides dokdonensis FR1436]